MKTMVVLLSLLWPAAALAQGVPASQGFPPPPGSTPAQAAPPTVGDKPLVQVKPRRAAKSKGAPAAKPQSMAVKLQACMEHDDGTKERLNCYDAVIKPQPKAKPPKANGVMDCRFVKEEDERLACFNGFVERLPKLPTQ
jgi:hypothetical protein